MKAEIKVVQVPVTTYRKDKVVCLELTKQEAETILALTGFIGGEAKGPRGVIDRLRAALCNAGLNPNYGVSITKNRTTLYLCNEFPEELKVPQQH